MSARCFKDLYPGEKFSGVAVVTKCSVGEAKNNKSYLNLTLTDGTASLPARRWDHSGDAPKEDTVVFIDSMVDQYKGVVQLIVSNWRNATVDEYKPGQFIPKCPVDYELLVSDFDYMMNSVADKQYSALLRTIKNSGIWSDYCTAPAAKSNHHAYIHGLLQHSTRVAFIAKDLGDNINVNTDLLVTGALIHDIGKTEEYDWSGCAITRSTCGKLLGHIPLGIMIINDFANDQGMSCDRITKLLHLIASHHGRLEWGSPVEPQTLEAVILHQADMIDFQVATVDKARAEAGDGAEWTGRTPGMGREFYIG